MWGSKGLAVAAFKSKTRVQDMEKQTDKEQEQAQDVETIPTKTLTETAPILNIGVKNKKKAKGVVSSNKPKTFEAILKPEDGGQGTSPAHLFNITPRSRKYLSSFFHNRNFR